MKSVNDSYIFQYDHGRGHQRRFTAQEDNPLRKEEKYGYVFKGEKSIQVYSIPKIFGAEEYDVSVFEASVFLEAVPLAFSKKQPALNDDVLCYEYSGTRIEKT